MMQPERVSQFCSLAFAVDEAFHGILKLFLRSLTSSK